MEEQKESDSMRNHIRRFYFIKFRPSPEELEKEEADKQYQLMNLARLRINEELDLQKAYEHQINQKIMQFTRRDERIRSKMWRVDNLKSHGGLDKAQSSLPPNSVPKTTGFLQLSSEDAQTLVRPNKKRCQKRLIKKGQMDIEYLQEVAEEHLSSKKSSRESLKKFDKKTYCGTQELTDLIESMVQRIQHGNKKRADEVKIYHKIENIKETREVCSAPEPGPQPKPHVNCSWYARLGNSKRGVEYRQFIQHKIDIELDEIEDIKRVQLGRKAAVARLKKDLVPVRKSISSLTKELKNVESKRIHAYKRGQELAEQKKGLISSYDEYESLMTYVRELGRKGDVMGLKQASDAQVRGFMRHWRDNNAFREDYEKRKLF